MTDDAPGTDSRMNLLAEASSRLGEAAAAKKCWPCGCLHQSLQTIEGAMPPGDRSPELTSALAAAKAPLLPVQYKCLGCQICYPALAVNAVSQLSGERSIDVCPTEAVEVRAGWPPLPGNYTLLRYQAPVAVCTLTNDTLSAAIAQQARPALSISGTLQTENLGIERLIQNTLANPHIRFLILCGPDSRQAIGHLPGQSLLALGRSGLDERSRIQGAAGKRPVLRNISREAVEHFRRTVELIDLIGSEDLAVIHRIIQECADRNPGPSEPFESHQLIAPIPGYVPQRMIPDPAGYFVVYVDRPHACLSLEHYQNTGLFDGVIQGRTAAELYTPAIEHGWISRLDHAAYLGRELARAEEALRTGGLYTQDAAPERGRLSTAPPRNVSLPAMVACHEGFETDHQRQSAPESRRCSTPSRATYPVHARAFGRRTGAARQDHL